MPTMPLKALPAQPVRSSYNPFGAGRASQEDTKPSREDAESDTRARAQATVYIMCPTIFRLLFLPISNLARGCSKRLFRLATIYIDARSWLLIIRIKGRDFRGFSDGSLLICACSVDMYCDEYFWPNGLLTSET